MKLGMDFPQAWKDRSEKSKMAIADILYGYAIEDLMVRLEQSSFHEYLWLTSDAVLTEAAYRKKVKDRISFYYYMEPRISYRQGKLQAGDALGIQIMELLAKEILQQERDDIFWTYYIEEKSMGFSLNMEAHYRQMRVPVVMWIEVVPKNAQKPKWKELKLSYIRGNTCRYMSYSKESILAENLFEIMRKLELVGDMEAYSVANEILKTDSISGRHILEEFRVLGEKEPKVVTMKRLEQIKGYKSYAYMKRKWQQYEKNHGCKPESWEQVLARIVAFLDPSWKALCDEEIFFDDWMPELGRFLG